MVASILINIMVALCLLNNRVAHYESNVGAPMVALLAIWLRLFSLDYHQKIVVRPPMVALLAIWLRSLSMLAKKMFAPHSMVYGCATMNTMWMLLWLRSWQYDCVHFNSYHGCIMPAK